MEYIYIYVGTNTIAAKQYVGQTKKPDMRVASHERSRKNPKTLIAQAISDYGFDAFAFFVIYVAFDQDEADRAEDYFIHELGTLEPAGYNARGGGLKGIGSGLSEPAKERHRIATLAAMNDPEMIERMRQSTLAQFADEEKRARHKAAYDNPETKAKLQAINEGKEHYTDGKTNILLKPGEPIPDGFKLGMLYQGDRASAQSMGRHRRWHVNRGILVEDCQFCAKLTTFWANDGTSEVEYQIGTVLPIGWVHGRLNYDPKILTNRGYIWITDGTSNQMITADEQIPDGWKTGMTKDKSASTHQRWHVNRNILNKDCPLCQEIISEYL